LKLGNNADKERLMNRRNPLFHLAIALGAVALASINLGCVASDKNTIAQASAFDTGLKPATIRGAQTSQYLQQIGGRIVAAAQELDKEKVGPHAHFDKGDNSWMFKDIQFQLVNSKVVNAFTTGGHYVYIYIELFKMCKSEDELAAVMAHEYGHIYCRHVQKGTGRQQTLALASLAAGGAGYVAGGSENGAQYSQSLMKAAQAGGGFIDMGFTRGDEAQADEFGFKFYTRAGWDPNHFADFFKDMIAAGYDTGSEYTSDHPKLSNRVASAADRAKKLGNTSQWRKAPIADANQFAQLKQQANAACAKQPTSDSLTKAKALLASFASCVSPNDNQPEQQQVKAAVAAKQKKQ
jgi:predicted Zn-dependent protease